MLAFLAVALAGLAVLVVSTPSVAGRLFGQEAFVASYSFPLFRIFGMPLLAIVTAVAGYLSPRGFWLWGIAAVSLRPVLEAWKASRANSLGAFGSLGIGESELLGLALVIAMIIFTSAVVCTVAAALGAGLRLLWGRLRGESVRDRLGIASEGDGPA
jgi:hypothetical protein